MKHLICNVCGKGFDDFDKINGFSISGSIGYGSKYDGDYISLDMCCECMDKLIDNCVIKPIYRIHNIPSKLNN